MAANIKGITIEIDGKTDKLSKALSNVNKDIKSTNTALKDVNKLLKVDPTNITLLKQKQELLNTAITDTKAKLNTEKEALKQLKAADQTPENIKNQQELEREIAATEQSLKALKKESKEFGSVFKQVMEEASSKVAAVGEKLTDAGKNMLPVTGAIAAVGTAAVKTTADFDSSMSQVAAISGAAGDDFDDLRNKAREMGATTKFSASEAADAMNYMAMAGWKTEDMIGGIDGILNLAAASGEELATTSDIVTDALTAFGLSAQDAGHFADVLAATSSNANTNVSMMGETFKYCAPAAGALGYSIEDVSLAIGLMGNSGIKASQAGTSLNNLFTRMAKPTKESAAAMERLGVSLADDDGRMYSFREIMDQLRSSFGQINMPIDEFNNQVAELDAYLADGTITQKKYDDALEELTMQAYGAEGAEKARAAAMLAGKTGMSGLLAIVNASSEDYEKLAGSIEGAEGAAQEMADIMQDNLNGEMTKLKSAIEELMISFGDMLMPTIREIVGYIQDTVNWLNSLDEETRAIIIVIALVLAAIGPVLIIIGKITTGISALMTFIPMLAGPVGIVIAVIAAAIAIGVLLYKNWDTITAKAVELRDKLVAAFREIKQGVVDEFNEIKDFIKNAVNSIIGYINGLISGITNGINSAISAMNQLHFDVPDWVPIVGGKSLGFNIPSITTAQIPLLANGAVIPPGREFLAMLGDQRNGNNLEAPESLLRQIVSEESATRVNVVLQGDARTFFKVMQVENNNYKTLTGNSAF